MPDNASLVVVLCAALPSGCVLTSPVAHTMLHLEEFTAAQPVTALPPSATPASPPGPARQPMALTRPHSAAAIGPSGAVLEVPQPPANSQQLSVEDALAVIEATRGEEGDATPTALPTGSRTIATEAPRRTRAFHRRQATDPHMNTKVGVGWVTTSLCFFL